MGKMAMCIPNLTFRYLTVQVGDSNFTYAMAWTNARVQTLEHTLIKSFHLIQSIVHAPLYTISF